jgi:transposase InsO family protein
LEKAFQKGIPDIFNSDQGSQFTSEAFTNRLEKAGIQISRDSQGRALDNIFVERGNSFCVGLKNKKLLVSSVIPACAGMT